jgi:cobalt-zinc-cadmium resistance protein CzcA
MTAQEVELQVTQPLETELLGIPDQAMLRSTTKYAITAVTLDFREGTDIYWARQQVNERLSSIWENLPDGISGGVAPMSTPLSEMFMFTIENPALSLIERRQLLDWEIRPILRTVEGVADVNVLGGYAKTYQISPSAALMAHAGINFTQLEEVIAKNNLNLGAGRLVQGNDTLIVRAEGRINSLDELENLVIKVDDKQIIRLGQVAEVSIGHLARYGAVTKDGTETTEALIIALKNSNTADVVAGVKRKLAELEPTLPPGTVINVFYDRANLIDTAISTISNALFQAIVIVVILLTLTGLEGKLFAPVAITIVFAMFAALVLSLTVVPIMASLLINESAARIPGPIQKLQLYYERSLVKVIGKPVPMLAAFAVLLVCSIALFAFIGKTFMPVLDEGDVIVQLEKCPERAHPPPSLRRRHPLLPPRHRIRGPSPTLQGHTRIALMSIFQLIR